MRFLELSDIHFVREVGGTHDLDRELRWGLMDALRGLAEVGKIDAILVAGDIAFSGSREQYGRATKFLRDVALALGVGLEMIFVVPGNHDIDRSKTDSSHQRALRSGLRNYETAATRDAALRSIAGKQEDAELLMAPLAEYIRFAAQYDCPTTVAAPCWQRSVLLTQEIELVLHGMNSVLASHQHDDHEKEPLVVGTGQAIFEPGEGRVQLAMCHHPPEWILDADEIRNRLDKRALVQVTGHTHEYQVVETTAGMRLRAGSLQPSRKEDTWQPHFSILEIAEDPPNLQVSVIPWAWDPQDLEFKPGDERSVRRSAPDVVVPNGRRDEIRTATAVRQLVVRLGVLSSGDVLNAAIEAGLEPLSGSLDDAPGVLAAQAVGRASDAGRLAELWDQMAARRNTTMENPFR